ncbi:transposase [Spongiibacter sp.]|uniref:transposase n=1 Tax=Spongiibacter sp. TaxID=2024860 RepID=UPI00356A7542
MPRQARFIVPGLPHHIVQRGHNRQAVFRGREDYQYYLDNLAEWKTALGIAVHAYCLMADCVHLIVSAPDDTSAIPKLMKHLAGRQTRFVNAMTQRSGSLWESRYRISPVDTEEFLLPCCRYIELSPVKAAIVEQPEDYLWSSCASRMGLRKCSWLDNSTINNLLGGGSKNSGEAYRAYLADNSADKHDEIIELAIQRNKLTGGKRFIDNIEQLTGVRIEMRGQGRPRKGQTGQPADLCAQ